MKRIKMDDIFEDELDYKIGPPNDCGIEFGDIFFISRPGINVFFFVCRTTYTQVCLFELANKKIKYQGKTVNILCDGLKPTQSPKIITHNNCWYKSRFWVESQDADSIIVPIEKDMPICKKINYPLCGYLIASKITEEEKQNGVLNYYWDIY